MKVLTVNVGSSSTRLALYMDGECSAQQTVGEAGGKAEAQLGIFLDEAKATTVDAIAHRVVHGGHLYTAPCRITADVEAEIDRLSELAPLHNPRALSWIAACRRRFGAALPQIAVFDTAFFVNLPPVASQYALPLTLTARWNLRRYGFHGIAHQSMWNTWAMSDRSRGRNARVITMQLGSGSSVAAIHDGRPMDTSMGFSPLEGLVMSTRCGDVDPGLLLYIQRQEHLSPVRLEELLTNQSGLLGMSALSSDLRVLLASTAAMAKQAVELYCYRARKCLGSYLAVLGGVDAIIFGGGVGEHLPVVRRMILSGMNWAGIALGPRNEETVGRQARVDDGGAVEVHVMPVDESAILEQQARAVLS